MEAKRDVKFNYCIFIDNTHSFPYVKRAYFVFVFVFACGACMHASLSPSSFFLFFTRRSRSNFVFVFACKPCLNASACVCVCALIVFICTCMCGIVMWKKLTLELEVSFSSFSSFSPHPPPPSRPLSSFSSKQDERKLN